MYTYVGLSFVREREWEREDDVGTEQNLTLDMEFQVPQFTL